MTYLPQTDKELITLACWASNAVGHQVIPCLIHILPASELIENSAYAVCPFANPFRIRSRVYILVRMCICRCTGPQINLKWIRVDPRMIPTERVREYIYDICIKLLPSVSFTFSQFLIKSPCGERRFPTKLLFYFICVFFSRSVRGTISFASDIWLASRTRGL